MENRSLVTIAEHSKEKILYMFEMAKQFDLGFWGIYFHASRFVGY